MIASDKPEVVVMKKIMKICMLILCLIFCWGIFFGFDTETKNKKKFRRTLGVELTPDVKDIHYYRDIFPSDYTILFSFTCDSSTVMRIVNANGLKLADDKEMGGLSFGFNWWNQEKINTIRPFRKKDKYRTYQYLWYDKDHQKAYYQEFST